MSKPTDLPIWDTAEERVLQPDITRQTTGWVWGSTKFEKPKGEHFNWWMNNVYKWTAHFDETIGDGSAKLWQNKATTINVTANADITLTATQNGYGRIIITDPGVLLTTVRNVIVDTSERSFLFQNDTARSLVVKTSAGSGITVTAGTKVELVCDATNIIESIDLETVWVANDTRAKTALNASGNAPIYACRAWVNFNGTGTVAIRASGNVSSITDKGVGKYSVNFITAMPDANYVVNVSSQVIANWSDSGDGIQDQTTTSFTDLHREGSGGVAQDTPINLISVFR
jgi:hypothetical protein